MPEQNSSFPDRRSFLARLSAGVATLAAALATGTAMNARAQAPGTGPWQPARHAKDDWLEQIPGRHRLVFDTTKSEGLSDALLFANNFIRTNRTEYDLPASDLALVIIVRHRSTSFGFNDQMWAKYGKQLSARSQYVDPKSKEAPTSNPFNIADRGNTFDSLFKQGAQLGVCAVATRAVAGVVAEATGQKTDDVFKELVANIVSGTNARLVPAGIVTVNRAQERGYSLVTT